MSNQHNVGVRCSVARRAAMGRLKVKKGALFNLDE